MISFDPNLEPVVCGPVDRIADERGSLAKIVADDRWSVPPLAAPPRQILHSATARRGTLRGLHAQTAPYSEAKRIFCLTGCIYWVVVDLRAASTTFGQWRGYELAPGAIGALATPSGFAHGCLSLTDDVNLLLLADKDYVPARSIGIAWNDPDLAVAWPLGGALPLISGEHAAFQSFAAFRQRYGGL